MDRPAAVKLIRSTFENAFDKGRLVDLARNLVKHLDESGNFSLQGSYIPDAFSQSIRSYDRVGKYDDADGRRIDVLVVRLKKEHALDRSRSMQRNFVAWYLNGSRGGRPKDAALVAFVSHAEGNWRFSLVKMDYDLVAPGKIQTELTPARRYSFLVGEGESSHTAQVQLLPILEDDETKPRLSDFEKAFNIEVVTREFFQKYRELFHRGREALGDELERNDRAAEDFEVKCVDTISFAKKLLGQVVFLYFLQKKGWFGVGRDENWGTGPRDFLRRLFDNEVAPYNNFFNDLLEPLFYEALALERAGDFYSRFDCKIPFLNGGLFDPMNNYDWVHTDILLDNALFSNSDRTKEGDVGTGILDVFDRYNFTVKEDEPLEKDVAVDPEMLGKVFENLLDVKDRKSKGTYYTPREIVHYMCQESLINYLDAATNTGEVPLVATPPSQGRLLGKPDPEQVALTAPGHRGIVPREDIEALVRMGELAVEHDTRVEAYGKETERYSYKLPERVRWNASLIDERLAEIRVCDPAIGSGAFPVGLMMEIVRARNTLTTYLPDKQGRTSYNFKRHAIQNCLYGVDIDPGAVEIAKLRLWLSMVVDEDDIKQIQPLPNLDYKIVCGNSLLGVKKDIFNLELFNELERLKLLYFSETNVKKKQDHKEQIDQLIMQITDDNKTFDFEVYFSEVFHEKGGFDVVIANPPYISHDRIEMKRSLRKAFKCYEPFADIYCYFIELGMKLQNAKGLLCYITSNSYLKARYGMPLRNTLRQHGLFVQLISVEDIQVFEAAIVNTAILMVFSRMLPIDPMCLVVSATHCYGNDFRMFVETNALHYSQADFHAEPWSLASPQKTKLRNKLEMSGKSLEQYNTKIRLGLATGANAAFIIDDATKAALIGQDPRSMEIIKPVLRGKDILRYRYCFGHRYILLTKNGVDVKRDYPAIYRHLDSFGDSFKKRGAQGDHWTNLRHCSFYDDFGKERIVWMELSDRGRFALCDSEIYLLNTAYYLIPPKQLLMKYLLGILNSKLIEFYLLMIAETSGMGVTRWINEHVKKFPIPEADKSAQAAIAEIVDRILVTVKDEQYRSDPVKQAKFKDMERQIDHMVYDLYDLTPEEIAVVEGALEI